MLCFHKRWRCLFCKSCLLRSRVRKLGLTSLDSRVLVRSSRLGNRVAVLVTVVLLQPSPVPAAEARIRRKAARAALLLSLPASTRLLVILLVQRTLATARASSLLPVLVSVTLIVRPVAVLPLMEVPSALASALSSRMARLVAALAAPAAVLLLLLLSPVLAPALVPILLRAAQTMLPFPPASTLLLAIRLVPRTSATARASSSSPALVSATQTAPLAAVLPLMAALCAPVLVLSSRTARLAADSRLPSEALSPRGLPDDSALKRTYAKTGDGRRWLELREKMTLILFSR